MNVTQNHKKWIKEALENLEAYDSKRPAGHPYPFHEHSVRVAEYMERLSRAAGYSQNEAEAFYWAMLVHDIGKTALPVTLWDLEDKPTEAQRMERRTHTRLGVHMLESAFGAQAVRADPFLALCADIMENHHETMDGKGFLGKAGEALSHPVRMACLCDAYDGWCVVRPHFGERDVSPESVFKRMTTEKAGQFDNELLKIFKKAIVQPAYHAVLENAGV